MKRILKALILGMIMTAVFAISVFADAIDPGYIIIPDFEGIQTLLIVGLISVVVAAIAVIVIMLVMRKRKKGN